MHMPLSKDQKWKQRYSHALFPETAADPPARKARPESGSKASAGRRGASATRPSRAKGALTIPPPQLPHAEDGVVTKARKRRGGARKRGGGRVGGRARSQKRHFDTNKSTLRGILDESAPGNTGNTAVDLTNPSAPTGEAGASTPPRPIVAVSRSAIAAQLSPPRPGTVGQSREEDAHIPAPMPQCPPPALPPTQPRPQAREEMRRKYEEGLAERRRALELRPRPVVPKPSSAADGVDYAKPKLLRDTLLGVPDATPEQLVGVNVGSSSGLLWAKNGEEIYTTSGPYVVCTRLSSAFDAAASSPSHSQPGAGGSEVEQMGARRFEQSIWNDPAATDVIGALALSPDGRLLATAEAGRSPQIVMWDTRTGKSLLKLNGPAYDISSLSFSPSGSRLACHGKDDNAREQLIIWNVASCQTGHATILAKQLSDFHVSRVKFVPHESEEKLVTVGHENIRFWRVTKGHMRGTPVQLNHFARGTTFTDVDFESSSGLLTTDEEIAQQVYVSSSRGAVFQIDFHSTTTPKLQCVFQLHSGAIQSMTINPGFCITAGADGFLRVWPLDFSDYLLQVKHETGLQACDISMDGVKVAVLTAGGSVGMLDMVSNQYVDLQSSHTSEIVAAAAPWTSRLPQRSTTLSSSHAGTEIMSDFVTGSRDGSVRVWNTSTWSQAYEFSLAGEEVTSLVYHPEMSKGIIAAGYDSGYVRIFDLEGVCVLFEYAQHRGPVLAVAFHPSGQYMYSVGRDGQLCMYDGLNDYSPAKLWPREPFTSTEESTATLAVDPSGHTIALSFGRAHAITDTTAALDKCAGAFLFVLDALTLNLVHRTILRPVAPKRIGLMHTAQERSNRTVEKRMARMTLPTPVFLAYAHSDLLVAYTHDHRVLASRRGAVMIDIQDDLNIEPTAYNLTADGQYLAVGYRCGTVKLLKIADPDAESPIEDNDVTLTDSTQKLVTLVARAVVVGPVSNVAFRVDMQSLIVSFGANGAMAEFDCVRQLPVHPSLQRRLEIGTDVPLGLGRAAQQENSETAEQNGPEANTQLVTPEADLPVAEARHEAVGGDSATEGDREGAWQQDVLSPPADGGMSTHGQGSSTLKRQKALSRLPTLSQANSSEEHAVAHTGLRASIRMDADIWDDDVIDSDGGSGASNSPHRSLMNSRGDVRASASFAEKLPLQRVVGLDIGSSKPVAWHPAASVLAYQSTGAVVVEYLQDRSQNILTLHSLLHSHPHEVKVAAAPRGPNGSSNAPAIGVSAGIQFSADGNWLVAAFQPSDVGAPSLVAAWERQDSTWRAHRVIQCHPGGLQAFDLSANGCYLVTVGYSTHDHQLPQEITADKSMMQEVAVWQLHESQAESISHAHRSKAATGPVIAVPRAKSFTDGKIETVAWISPVVNGKPAVDGGSFITAGAVVAQWTFRKNGWQGRVWNRVLHNPDANSAGVGKDEEPTQFTTLSIGRMPQPDSAGVSSKSAALNGRPRSAQRSRRPMASEQASETVSAPSIFASDQRGNLWLLSPGAHASASSATYTATQYRAAHLAGDPIRALFMHEHTGTVVTAGGQVALFDLSRPTLARGEQAPMQLTPVNATSVGSEVVAACWSSLPTDGVVLTRGGDTCFVRVGQACSPIGGAHVDTITTIASATTAKQGPVVFSSQRGEAAVRVWSMSEAPASQGGDVLVPELVDVIRCPAPPRVMLAFEAHDQMLLAVVTGDSELTLFDVDTQQTVSASVTDSTINTLAWAKSSSTLVVGTRDGGVEFIQPVWSTGQAGKSWTLPYELTRLQLQGQDAAVHEQLHRRHNVVAIDAAGDEDCLLVGSDNGALSVWTCTRSADTASHQSSIACLYTMAPRGEAKVAFDAHQSALQLSGVAVLTDADSALVIAACVTPAVACIDLRSRASLGTLELPSRVVRLLHTSIQHVYTAVLESGSVVVMHLDPLGCGMHLLARSAPLQSSNVQGLVLCEAETAEARSASVESDCRDALYAAADNCLYGFKLPAPPAGTPSRSGF